MVKKRSKHRGRLYTSVEPACDAHPHQLLVGRIAPSISHGSVHQTQASLPTPAFLLLSGAGNPGFSSPGAGDQAGLAAGALAAGPRQT